MKIALILASVIAIAMIQTGCSAGASVGHDGHRHGVGVAGSTHGPGVSAGVRAY